MNEAIEKRQYLNNWAKNTDKCKVVQITRDYPNCGCEKAAAAEDGFGPVSDAEILRTFITSTYNIKLNKSVTKTITPSIFRNIFKTGLSTIRLEHANKDEIIFTAKELYEYQAGFWASENLSVALGRIYWYGCTPKPILNGCCNCLH